jgi:hypothetical protein
VNCGVHHSITAADDYLEKSIWTFFMFVAGMGFSGSVLVI